MLLKTELTMRIRKAMKEKGISSYRELLKKSEIKINPHFNDFLTGRTAIKEEELLKISETLDIPLDFLIGKMKKEVKYRVIDIEPVAEEYDDVKKREKLREYNRLYKRQWRKKRKVQSEVKK